ncbi:hypothetical protein [Chishuiella sp.]|uniref:hypothetical protein n=1 Tax=Chishuiella sp. TaxID=1969467 RepID=UPI0028B08540|nr:hypothetical protein [Chishuiella sp.]
MKNIHASNPAILIFVTDLPSTRAKITFSRTDIKLIKNHFSESEQNAIFYENAEKWYEK